MAQNDTATQVAEPEQPHAADVPATQGASTQAPADSPQTTEPQKDQAGAPHQQNGKNGGDDKSKKKSAPWVKPVVLTVVVVALIFGGIWFLNYWHYSQGHTATDDAYLTSDLVQVTPQVNGNIARLYVNANDHVNAGQLLFQLDDATFRADVESAKANLEVARDSARGAGTNVALTNATGNAQIEQAQGGLQQADSGIGAAQADVERSRASIADAGAGVQSAVANVSSARAALQSALASRQRAVEAVQGARAQVNTALAGVRVAQAGIASARANADKALKDEQRYRVLYDQDAISAQQYDTAVAAATAASAQLDSANQTLAQAQATVQQRQSDLASAQDAIRVSDAAIAQARAQVSATQGSLAAAQANVKQAQAQLNSSQQNVAVAEGKRTAAQGQLTQAQTAPRQVSVQQANAQTARARILQAEAALRNAEIALQRTRIYAPAAGRISADNAEVGQQVAIGQAVMAVIPDNDLWVTANFKETQLQNMHVNQEAEIEVDTFPDRKFRGYVQSLAAGTGNTFALLPADNSTGNFTKVVQRVPVKVYFDPKQKGLDQLRAGLSAVVTITTK